MLDYVLEGGWTMGLMIVTALVAFGWAYGRPRSRARVLRNASVVVLMEGMLGIASGLTAVSKNLAAAPDPARQTLVGLGELAHNGTLSAGLFIVLAVASVVLEATPDPSRG